MKSATAVSVSQTASTRPPRAWTTAWAESVAKPMAWAGSVTSADGKYSMGGYSMSAQSTTVPAVMRLVGAAITGVGIAVSVGAGVGVGVAAGVGEGPPAHAATIRLAPMATEDLSHAVRFTVSPPLRSACNGDGAGCLGACVGRRGRPDEGF